VENPLRKWRSAQGLRAVDVALKLNISEQSVLAYEMGRFGPSAERFTELSHLLGEPVAELRLRWRLWRKGEMK